MVFDYLFVGGPLGGFRPVQNRPRSITWQDKDNDLHEYKWDESMSGGGGYRYVGNKSEGKRPLKRKVVTRYEA